jgi:aminoglycoside/choline kinase family phosphotransferase
VAAQLFQRTFGPIKQMDLLSASGSERQYYRILPTRHDAPASVIAMHGGSMEEARAFVYMSRHFQRKGLPVPLIYAAEEHLPVYLQEDLGTQSLFDVIRQGRTTGVFSKEEEEAVTRVIRLLPLVQVKGDEGMDYSVCTPQASFNRRTVIWDLNYFKYCFLKTTPTPFNEDRLEDDFGRMADDLTGRVVQGFMYRDFQSRNVMIRPDGTPALIDYQGGRRGPVLYDVASFVWQAKARYPEALRRRLVEEYLDALSELRPVDKEVMRRQLRRFVLFRMMQVLGAYGFRGKWERKPHFLESIPFGLKNLQEWIAEYEGEFNGRYPHLTEVLKCMVEKN